MLVAVFFESLTLYDPYGISAGVKKVELCWPVHPFTKSSTFFPRFPINIPVIRILIYLVSFLVSLLFFNCLFPFQHALAKRHLVWQAVMLQTNK